MAAIPFNTLRAAKQGDTVLLDGQGVLNIEWTSRVPVDLTVVGPSGRTGGVRLEPQATVQVDPTPQRASLTLWREVDSTGQPAAGKVEYTMGNGAAKPDGIMVGLVTG